MIGGFKGAASRLALAALFGAVGSVAFMHQQAKAADLGGDCCSDLEERVAELEATTVRKGNKKVSITLYGKANHAVLFWDDGHEKNTYVVDNSYESSRFGFKGSAKISGNWSAGYKMEVEDVAAASNAVNQIDDDNGFRAGGTPTSDGRLLFLRHSYMYLNNKDYGELRWGLTMMPKDDITKDTDVTQLADTITSDNMMNRGFFLRPKGFNTEVGGAGQLKWNAISRCYSASDAFDCSTRRNAVTYYSPTFFGSTDGKGFSASWGWGEDDIWSAALRYTDDWFNKAFSVGAGAGYEKFRDENFQNSGGGLNGFQQDIDEWAGDASIKHNPTGLFVFASWSLSNDNQTNRQNAGVFDGKSSPDMSAWDIRGGIQRKFSMFGLDQLGDTSLFGGYLEINDGIGGACGVTRFCKAGTFPDLAIPTEITGAKVTRWYLGYDQAMVSGYLHLYGVYQHLTADVNLVNSSLKKVNEPLDDFDLFYTGARMYF
jgi:predicted porin